MPIDIRLTAVPAPAGVPLAAHLATLIASPGGEPGGGADIVVAVQGAETAGLDPLLGGPVADVLAACQATGKAGEVTPMAIWLGGRPHRLSFLGLGDGSAADLRKAGTALRRRAAADRVMLAAAALGSRRRRCRPSRRGCCSVPTGSRSPPPAPRRPRGPARCGCWSPPETSRPPARFSPDGDEPKGATGLGPRLLLRWLCDLGQEADAAKAP